MNNCKKDIVISGFWKSSEVKLLFNDEFFTPKKEVKSLIEKKWSNLKKLNPSCFDGEMLRLIQYSTKENGRLFLKLEKTNFSHYIATRDSDFKKLFSDNDRANPIGLTTLIITNENNIVVTKRSSNAEQNPNKLYFSGGYAEPIDNSKKISNTHLLKEAKREIKEELGLTKIAFAYYIGMAYDPIYCHPELFMILGVNYSNQQIKQLWSIAKDRDEFSDIYFVDLKSFINLKCIDGLKKEPTWSFCIGRELFNLNKEIIFNNIKFKK